MQRQKVIGKENNGKKMGLYRKQEPQIGRNNPGRERSQGP